LSDFTAKPGDPECEDPNALIESGELDMMNEMTTVQNLRPGLDSSKKKRF